jgi:hypothetical protein
MDRYSRPFPWLRLDHLQQHKRQKWRQHEATIGNPFSSSWFSNNMQLWDLLTIGLLRAPFVTSLIKLAYIGFTVVTCGYHWLPSAPKWHVLACPGNFATQAWRVLSFVLQTKAPISGCDRWSHPAAWYVRTSWRLRRFKTQHVHLDIISIYPAFVSASQQ